MYAKQVKSFPIEMVRIIGGLSSCPHVHTTDKVSYTYL